MNVVTFVRGGHRYRAEFLDEEKAAAYSSWVERTFSVRDIRVSKEFQDDGEEGVPVWSDEGMD